MTKERKWLFFTVIAFTAGVFAGGLYCALMRDGASMYEYLQKFIVGIKSGTDKAGIFRKSVISDMKPILLIMLCAFIRFGYVPIFAVSGIRGFYVGFTFASLFKYFGNNGILLILSQLPAELIFFAAIVIFGAICARAAALRKDKNTYIAVCISFAAATLFVLLSAVCEGYLDTWLIESIANRLY